MMKCNMQNILLRNILNKIAATDVRVPNGTDFENGECLYSACTLMNSLDVFFHIGFSAFTLILSILLDATPKKYLFVLSSFDGCISFPSFSSSSVALCLSLNLSHFSSRSFCFLLFLFHFKVIKYFSNTLVRMCCATEDINDFPMRISISSNFT